MISINHGKKIIRIKYQSTIRIPTVQIVESILKLKTIFYIIL